MYGEWALTVFLRARPFNLFSLCEQERFEKGGRMSRVLINPNFRV
jgi:hypothetical protein